MDEHIDVGVCEYYGSLGMICIAAYMCCIHEVLDASLYVNAIVAWVRCTSEYEYFAHETTCTHDGWGLQRKLYFQTVVFCII